MGKCCDNPAVMLKKRVTIQNIAREEDGQGGYTETWASAATVWASIEPVKGWERYQAAQLATPVTHKIVMRYTPAVSTASRLIYDGRVFGVKECLNRNEDNRFLDIRALELESVTLVAETFRILLEDGFALLLEDNSNLLLEAA